MYSLIQVFVLNNQKYLVNKNSIPYFFHDRILNALSECNCVFFHSYFQSKDHYHSSLNLRVYSLNLFLWSSQLQNERELYSLSFIMYLLWQKNKTYDIPSNTNSKWYRCQFVKYLSNINFLTSFMEQPCATDTQNHVIHGDVRQKILWFAALTL